MNIPPEGWPPPGLESLPTLETPRLVLRPFVPADAPEVHRLAGDQRIAATTATIPHPYPEGASEAWIASHAEQWTHAEGLNLAMTRREAGELIGSVGLTLVVEHLRAELGYWVGVPWWGQGFATEAAASVVRFGFDRLHLHRIYARCFPRNPASGRVLERIGMQYEGRQLQHLVRFGRHEDVDLYGMLRTDQPVA